MVQDQKKCAAAGYPKSKANQYNNCLEPPMIGNTGKVINKMSIMSLHLSLGLGKQLVDIFENEAIRLDSQIHIDNGISSEPLRAAMVERENLLQKRNAVLVKQTNLENKLTEIEKDIQTDTTSNPQFHEKVGNKVIDKSKEAVKARKELRDKKINRLQIHKEHKEHTENQEAIKKLGTLLENNEKLVKNQRGIFQTKYDSVMENMNFKRQVYHSGAVVGQDVKKMVKEENILKLSNIFTPTTVMLMNGLEKTYSTYKLRQKMLTLIHKLAQVYCLMSISRPLCRHEVNYLTVQCYSFGNWFPVNFPSESMKRKFHILVCHVPEKAQLRCSTGMEAEHCSESIHPVVNKSKRRYATVQNTEQQLSLVCKDQWLASNQYIPDYRITKKRK